MLTPKTMQVFIMGAKSKLPNVFVTLSASKESETGDLNFYGLLLTQGISKYLKFTRAFLVGWVERVRWTRKADSERRPEDRGDGIGWRGEESEV